MRISVIIPTYKRPRTLLQALRSLQEQTLPDFEIVVVDNAADSEVEKMVSVFSIDNHDAADPRLLAITAPIIRTGVWDIGAYEYEETQFGNVGQTPTK